MNKLSKRLEILATKILLGGRITVEDYSEPPSQWKMDGKQIARNYSLRNYPGKGY